MARKMDGYQGQAQAPSRETVPRGAAEGGLHQPEAVTRPAVSVAINSRSRRPASV
jgi:hypothetical protein